FLRDERGLSQGELASELGVTRDNVASYERGSIPKLEVLLRIVNYFHKDLQILVEKDLEVYDGEADTQLASDYNIEYQKTSQTDDVTLETLQKMIKVQEKYIKALEEKL